MKVTYDSFIAEQIDIVVGVALRKKEAEILELKAQIEELGRENEKQRIEILEMQIDIEKIRKKYAGLLL